MNKINILVFPCGSEIAFEVYDCLYKQKNINLIGASSIDDTGKFVFKNYIGDVPNVANDEFIHIFKDIVSTQKIDYVYPTMDIVLLKLKQYESELGCKVLGSDFKTVKIFSQKSLTYDYFKDLIRTPKVFCVDTSFDFPVFSKPDIGSSSRNIMIVEDEIDLAYSRKKYPNNILLEYLPGKEFTVDCFSDKNNKLIFTSARERTKITNGISTNSKLVKDKKIDEIANIINNNIKLSGPWFFQLKKDINDEYCLLEIADRFGGSSIINRILGVNFAFLNILKEMYDVSISTNSYNIEIGKNYKTHVISSLNFDSVYIDLDDTVVFENKVNIDAICFLYKCLNLNKKIYLLTRHKGNVEKTLTTFKIDMSIFDGIYHTISSPKSIFIKEKNAIFVDDSFTERQEVKTTLNIPVFSVENIPYIL